MLVSPRACSPKRKMWGTGCVDTHNLLEEAEMKSRRGTWCIKYRNETTNCHCGYICMLCSGFLYYLFDLLDVKTSMTVIQPHTPEVRECYIQRLPAFHSSLINEIAGVGELFGYGCDSGTERKGPLGEDSTASRQ